MSSIVDSLSASLSFSRCRLYRWAEGEKTVDEAAKTAAAEHSSGSQQASPSKDGVVAVSRQTSAPPSIGSRDKGPADDASATEPSLSGKGSVSSEGSEGGARGPSSVWQQTLDAALPMFNAPVSVRRGSSGWRKARPRPNQISPSCCVLRARPTQPSHPRPCLPISEQIELAMKDDPSRERLVFPAVDGTSGLPFELFCSPNNPGADVVGSLLQRGAPRLPTQICAARAACHAPVNPCVSSFGLIAQVPRASRSLRSRPRGSVRRRRRSRA